MTPVARFRPHTLPPSWTWSTVGELTDVVRGGSPRPKGDPRYFGGPIPWIMISDVTRQPGKYLYETREGVTQAGAARSRLIRSGELVLSNSGTVCVPKILRTDGCIHDGFVAFPQLSRHVDLVFAYYWFEYIRPTVVDQNRQGITQVNLNTQIVRDLPFPLASREAQLRLVEELEQQLSRLAAAAASLEAAQRRLKAYRASVLKAAVEGRLVPTEAELTRSEGRVYESAGELLERMLKERRRRWEESELAKMQAAGKTPKDDRWKEKYSEPERPDVDTLPGLPEGWRWATIDQLSTLVRNGHPTPPRAPSGVRTLRISAVRPLAIDFQDVRYLPGHPSEYADDLVDLDDLLFTRYNGTPALVGVCGRVRFLDRDTVHPDKLIKVRLVDSVMSAFVEIASNTGLSRRHVEVRTRTTAGQAGISGADLKRMPIPLPPQAEQERISSSVDRLLTIDGATRRDIESALRRCAALRQAVLRSAFDGRLVDQDLRDEPADALLARIRAERAGTAPAIPKARRARKLKAAS
jgi:type I restriction enzyme, S subunit